MSKNYITYVLLIIGLQLSSCSSSSDPEETLPVSFQMQPESNNPNFITFIATSATEGATYEWTFSHSNQKQTGSHVTVYFEHKGSYEVTLKQTAGGMEGSTTRKVNVATDSYYAQQGEQLWWHDEFEGARLDNTSWNYDTGIGKWGNNEWQNYTNKADNSFLRNGCLVIKALKTGEGQQIGDYTSARLTTKGKRELNRGRVEVRAKMPSGVGLWAAIWLFGTKAQPYYSELDLLEYVGCDQNIIYGAVHTTETLEGTQKISEQRTVTDVETAFHTYGLLWSDNQIEYYLDTPDNVFLTFTPTDKSDPRCWPFDKELYLILNLAVGGDWGGMRGVDDTIFPREMEVDYVRIFK
ncbi:MAG: family 16 glycosylhydrolase [Bacteroides sp.]|nr:family 16 glycosylhydrolase [Bacteroides sp.]